MQKIIALITCGCFIAFTGLAQSNITKAEYFINIDPGFGNGLPITVLPGIDISDINAVIPVSSLVPGLHTLYIRSANANNVWSITNHLLFLKTTLPPAVNIAAAECFIDADPGFGLGTSIPIASGLDVPDVSVTVDIASKSLGLHTVYIRSKDANGKWSIANHFLFLKTILPPVVNITSAEYFVDDDPGFGMATPITVSNDLDVPGITVPVDISSKNEGLHTLYIRSKDANSKWSITDHFLFFKTSNELYNITAAEYFIDTDAGFGNGTGIPITPSTDIDSISFNVDLTSIDTGKHIFFVRSKAANGKWSITNWLEFNKDAVLPVTWLSFEAIALDNQSLLEWRTTNEQNSSYFDVEYSIDGFHFKQIKKEEAKGYSLSATTHSFLHQNPLKNGLNYYRLKQVDKDGKFTYSPVRAVKFATSSSFVVSPNPVQNSLNVYTKEQELTVHLFESSGKRILSKQIVDYATLIDVSSLAKGMYYVVAERNSKVVYSTKIIKL